MFSKSAHLYNAIYSHKDYAAEVKQVDALIQRYKRSPDNTLLNVACGTGSHMPFFQEQYAVEGLDLDEGMLAIARQRFPEVTFHQGDMANFHLERRFDIIACLFNSIGYVKTVSRLQQTIQTMAHHLMPGGIIIINPWHTPQTYQVGSIHAIYVNCPDLKIARMVIDAVDGHLSILDMHYLVATPKGIEHFIERHELGLFSHEEYLEAFRAAGLDVIYEPQGLKEHGAYVGIDKAFEM